MSTERLHKFLARAGVASRRASERLIRQGLVRVNNQVVTELGTQIDPLTDRVEFDGRQVVADARFVYILLNKPTGTISAAADPEGRPIVTDLVDEDFGRIYPVGRLDWDSEGALLLTNDGELTNLLTHPRHEVMKTYLVKVRGKVADADPKLERLRAGVRLDDGYRTAPAEIMWDSDTGAHTWLVVGIREGKNRQVRRMFEAEGMTVLRLRRIAYGPVVMGDLRPAAYRRLSEDEVEELYRAAGGKRPALSASRGRLATKQREGKTAAHKAAKRLSGPAKRAGEPRPPSAGDERGPREDARAGGNRRASHGPSRGPAKTGSRPGGGGRGGRTAPETRSAAGARSQSGKPAAKGGKPVRSTRTASSRPASKAGGGGPRGGSGGGGPRGGGGRGSR